MRPGPFGFIINPRIELLSCFPPRKGDGGNMMGKAGEIVWAGSAARVARRPVPGWLADSRRVPESRGFLQGPRPEAQDRHALRQVPVLHRRDRRERQAAVRRRLVELDRRPEEKEHRLRDFLGAVRARRTVLPKVFSTNTRRAKRRSIGDSSGRGARPGTGRSVPGAGCCGTRAGARRPWTSGSGSTAGTRCPPRP